jgi:hypothetical protein
MNNGSLDPQHSPENGLSLEVVLGWSPVRISIVILSPIILSLAIGLWFQSRNPRDLITIQTAWGIATYVVTTGSCKFWPSKLRPPPWQQSPALLVVFSLVDM